MQKDKVQNNRTVAGTRIINFRTLLFCAVFLSLGILFAYARALHGLRFLYVLLLIPLIGVICLLAFTRAQWRRICVSVGLIILSFALGAVSFFAQINAFTKTEPIDKTATISGRVIAKETDGETFLITVDKLVIDSVEVDGKASVYLKEAEYASITYADELLFSGKVQSDTDCIGRYGFRAETIDKGVRYYVNASECVKVGEEFNLFLLARGRIEKAVYAGMDGTSAGVTMATLTGDTSGVDAGLLENIRRGGIAHIFAVSGLHIGALYAFCLLLVQKTRLKKLSPPWRFALVFAVLLFYGGVCGYSSSVIRATTMCLLLYFAKLAGLGKDSLETISGGALVVLLLSPVSLFTVGFQLSFASCFGIALFSKRIKALVYSFADWVRYSVFRKERKPFVLEEDTHPLTVKQRVMRACVSFLSVTVSAQLATTPILMGAFGYASVWSLLLNCLFVPIIGAMFSVLLLFVLVACIVPLSWSVWILYVPNVVWSVLLLAFETLDFSTVFTFEFPAGAVFAYYVALVFACGKWNVKRSWTRVLAGLALILAVCGMVMANV